MFKSLYIVSMSKPELSGIDGGPEEDQKINNSENNGEENSGNRRSIPPVPTAVDVHPLVLLSVVDHFTRMNAKSLQAKRVVGLLLGNVIKAEGVPRLDITTSFAVPFDEDMKDPDVWFLDTNYAEQMWLMYRKVLPKIKVVGWYSSGPEICSNDLNIHLLVAQHFCTSPIYCIVNANPQKKGVPVVCYTTTESRGAQSVEFRNIISNLGTVEAEEIGIVHLLRDLTDSTITTLSTKINNRHLALTNLEQLLGNIEQYLRDVVAEKLPICTEVLAELQEVINYLPLVHKLKNDQGLLVTQNDQELVTFTASVARCVTALYEVIVNRRQVQKELKARREKREEAHLKELQAKRVRPAVQIDFDKIQVKLPAIASSSEDVAKEYAPKFVSEAARAAKSRASTEPEAPYLSLSYIQLHLAAVLSGLRETVIVNEEKKDKVPAAEQQAYAITCIKDKVIPNAFKQALSVKSSDALVNADLRSFFRQFRHFLKLFVLFDQLDMDCNGQITFESFKRIKSLLFEKHSSQSNSAAANSKPEGTTDDNSPDASKSSQDILAEEFVKFGTASSAVQAQAESACTMDFQQFVSYVSAKGFSFEDATAEVLKK